MEKYVVVAALAAVLAAPEAASQSLAQKSDWQPRTFQSYLPAPSIVVPWLDLDRQTKLPKRDWRDRAGGPAPVRTSLTDRVVSR